MVLPSQQIRYPDQPSPKLGPRIIQWLLMQRMERFRSRHRSQWTPLESAYSCICRLCRCRATLLRSYPAFDANGQRVSWSQALLTMDCEPQAMWA